MRNKATQAQTTNGAVNSIPEGATHVATLDGEQVYFNAQSFGLLDALVERHPGKGAPEVRALSDLAALPAVAPAKPTCSTCGMPRGEGWAAKRCDECAPGNNIGKSEDDGGLRSILGVIGATAVLGDGRVVLPVSTFAEQVHDEGARIRIEEQHAALRKAGVAVDASQQLYATGTRMAQVGYDTQEQRRREHDAKLPVGEAADALCNLVREEQREDVVLSAREVGDAISVNGKLKIAGFGVREQAIRGLLARLDSPALGYAIGLRDRIVSEVRKGEQADRKMIEADKASLAEVLRWECRRNPDVKLKLRTRKAVGDVFTVVSPSYSVADAPEALAKLLPGLPSARATYAYDPVSTAWELRASVWTPTEVAQQAVGEAFEGYVSFWSKDDGTGSLRGGGGATMLRCLNASTYAAASSEVRRRHVGDVLGDVRAMLAGATTAIETLCAAWGLARAEEIKPAEIIPGGLREGMPASEILSGIFFAELRNAKGELSGVLPGRSADHAKALAEVYEGERRDGERLVRADLAQAWTRYIQGQEPAVRREAEGAIGQWLVSPRPIAWAPCC